MATIYNSDLSKELIDGAKIQISRDRIPNEIAEKVVPVMEVNPKLLRRADIILSANRVATGTTTIYTTPATGKDFYITDIGLSFSKDAACDMAIGDVYIGATINGVVTTLCRLATLTLTAESKAVEQNFKYPIKVDRGTAINLSAVGGYAAGLMSRSCTIKGYFVENINS